MQHKKTARSRDVVISATGSFTVFRTKSFCWLDLLVEQAPIPVPVVLYFFYLLQAAVA